MYINLYLAAFQSTAALKDLYLHIYNKAYYKLTLNQKRRWKRQKIDKGLIN